MASLNIFRKLATVILFLLTPYILLAQEITDFTYQLVDTRVEISYTLSGQASDRYEVNLYHSLDNYTRPLTQVTGDIGMDIVPGRNKKVTWDAKTELGEFKGGLSLKLRSVFIPFLTFDISKGSKFKRGKSAEIRWDGYSGKLDLELYQGRNRVSTLAALSSASSFTWNIPKEFNLGSEYRMKASGNGREVYSGPFSVKRKVPMALWIAPGVAVVGGIVAIIAGSGGTEPEANLIPEPIGPN